MKEIHKTSFRPVLAKVLTSIAVVLFILGLIAVAILRIFFLGSEDTFNFLIGTIVVTVLLFLLGRAIDKKTTETEDY